MSVEKKEKHRKAVNIGKSSRQKCHVQCYYSGLCCATGEQKQAVMLFLNVTEEKRSNTK